MDAILRKRGSICPPSLVRKHERGAEEPATPAVEPPRTPVASSRTRCQVYDVCITMPRPAMPPRLSVACAVRERRKERASLTRPNVLSTREAVNRGVPDAAAMSDGATNTGRLPSPASVNAGVASRLRSR